MTNAPRGFPIFLGILASTLLRDALAQALAPQQEDEPVTDKGSPERSQVHAEDAARYQEGPNATACGDETLSTLSQSLFQHTEATKRYRREQAINAAICVYHSTAAAPDVVIKAAEAFDAYVSGTPQAS
jgi:hypothetical protein